MANLFSKIFGPSNKASRTGTTTAATPLWIGATIVFAVLFFLSAVLDMKVNVTFGQAGSTGTYQSTPTTTNTSSGIADQIGGC